MIEKDISQYLSLEQRARNLFGENYDLENCVEELRQYRNTTLSPEQVRTLQTRFADVSLRLGEYMAIGTPEECRAAVEQQIPKRPTLCKSDEQTTRYTADYRCPKCNGMFTGTGIANYCYHCGQRLDWEELT